MDMTLYYFTAKSEKHLIIPPTKKIIREDRSLKDSSYDIFIDDREEAYLYVLKLAHNKVNNLKNQTQKAIEVLDKLRLESAEE